jgi:hypothetical protein
VRLTRVPVRRLFVLALALIATTGIAACGGPGSANDAVGVGAPPGTEVVAVVVAPQVPGTSRVANTAAFCQDIEHLQTLLPALLRLGAQAATLNQVEALLSRTEADAPDDLRPDVTQVRQTEDQLIKDLSATPPDYADVSRAYRNPAFQRSLQQVGLYALNQC